MRFQPTKHWQLLLSLVVRDIQARYRGSWLGLFWALLTPVLLMLVYYFVFTHVFQIRMPELYDEREVPFAGFIFAGILMYFIFAEVLTKSPGLIADNVNYVKKVVFPIEIIPLVAVLGAAFNLMLSLIILSLFLLFSGHGLSWAMLALPLVIVPYVIFLAGLSWFVSALSVYIRDVFYVAGFIATAMMFLSPVFYALESVPVDFREWMLMNPLTHFIENFRLIMIGGQVPGLDQLWGTWLASAVMVLLGYAFFQRVRHGFADIL